MPELTRVERERMDTLKGKTMHPSAIPLDPGVRTEGEEIEFRRLTERADGEERLAALRAQDVRSPEEFEEMRLLGAPDDEIGDGQRRQAEVEAKEAKVAGDASRAVPGTPAAERTERDRLDHQRAGDADAASARARETAPADRSRPPQDGRAADARADSDRIARDAGAVQEQESARGARGRDHDGVARDARERAERGEQPARDGSPTVPGGAAERPTNPLGVGAATPPVLKANADRLAALRAMPNRTPAQNEELRALEGSAG